MRKVEENDDKSIRGLERVAEKFMVFILESYYTYLMFG